MIKAHLESRGWRSKNLRIAGVLAIAAGWGCSDPAATSGDFEGVDADVSANDAGLENPPGRGKTSGAEDGALSPLPMPDAAADADKGGPPSLVTVQIACDMRADRFCSRLEACSPFTLRAIYGRYEVCRARLAARCAWEASLPDSGHTTYSLVSCAQTIAVASCEAVLDERELEGCRPTGRKREGVSCVSHTQCASGFCNLKQQSKSDGCGTCQAKQAIGNPCAENPACTAGLVCAQGQCRKPGANGADCDERLTACEAHLACVQGKCVAPLAAGVACESTRQCARNDGYVCGGDLPRAQLVSAPVCRMTSVALAAEVCLVDGNVVAHCFGGPANCVQDSMGSFRCVKAARDGEPCGDPAQQTGCEAPARCVGGTCRLAPATSCNL